MFPLIIFRYLLATVVDVVTAVIFATIPFLIGKVLTIYVGYTWMSDLSMWSFPFLIGKVLTLVVSPSQPELGWVMFPFLIGKVLTTAFKPL